MNQYFSSAGNPVLVGNLTNNLVREQIAKQSKNQALIYSNRSKSYCLLYLTYKSYLINNNILYG